MKQKECIAMILAGGKGTRLGALTSHVAKPGVCFGGKYRIIDFTLSNCKYSGIDALGVLTQYHSSELHNYIDNGRTWELDKKDGGLFLLPSSKYGREYMGTANAVYQNMKFIERFNPEYVIILSGDHIYKMDYQKMLNFHKNKGADATIAFVPVPLSKASQFGILKTDEKGLVSEFREKPNKPDGNFASMGIYIFKWSCLKKYLTVDERDGNSEHDFGKDIIPAMLSSGSKLYAYRFDGYWRDVGTIQSLWESNMDLLKDFPEMNPYDKNWKILTKYRRHPFLRISEKASIGTSFIGGGCNLDGRVENSVLFNTVNISEGAQIIDSVLMPNVFVGKNAKIHKAIIGANTMIGENAEIGAEKGFNNFVDPKLCSNDISLIGPGICVNKYIKIKKNSHISRSLMPERHREPLVN